MAMEDAGSSLGNPYLETLTSCLGFIQAQQSKIIHSGMGLAIDVHIYVADSCTVVVTQRYGQLLPWQKSYHKGEGVGRIRGNRGQIDHEQAAALKF
jgi:hypothetical protein